MTFSVLCLGIIALYLGLVMIFTGYRFFIVLVPFWGFLAGLFIGAQTFHVLTNVRFLTMINSWVASFLLGSLFAVLSYLFYEFAVALVSFSLAYGVTVGVMGMIAESGQTRVWLLGMILGVLFTLVVNRLSIEKFVVIVATSSAGTGIVIFTLLSLFGNYPALPLLESPVQHVLQNSYWWSLFFTVVVVIGVLIQVQISRKYEIEPYNRLATNT